jgi:hypothetical protein
MSVKSLKEKILENLWLVHDEPELFQFKVFSKQLADFLLDPKTPSPYTIGLHGEWEAAKRV